MDIYTTGYFVGTVDFDPGLGTTNLMSNGQQDNFVQKLDPNGNLVWVKHIGGIGIDRVYAINIDGNGNVYTVGEFQNTVDFDPGPGTTTLTVSGVSDVFIQKLDSSGNFLWARHMGGSIGESGLSITTDPNGNVYTTGYFYGTSDFDPGIGITTLTSVGASDAFIQKLDSSGNFLWVNQIGGPQWDEGRSIITDASNNVYTTGRFAGTIDFDPGIDTMVLTANGPRDIFIQKLSQCSFTYATDVQTACESFTWIDGITYTASNDSASYTLINAAGCDSVVALDLTIESVDISTTVANHTITATNVSATYQWIDCASNMILAGETSQIFTPTVNGTYAVILTENSCSDTSACIALTSVSIDDPNSNGLVIYPNPSKDGMFTIHYDGYIEYITVYDLAGRLLLEEVYQTPSLNLSALSPGVYYIQIKIENGGIMIKEIVIGR